jgi:hypothetical protein
VSAQVLGEPVEGARQPFLGGGELVGQLHAGVEAVYREVAPPERLVFAEVPRPGCHQGAVGTVPQRDLGGDAPRWSSSWKDKVNDLQEYLERLTV